LVKRQHVLLTTSRRPTKNIRTLCRDISYVFPHVVQINRGKLSLEGIAEKALELGVEKVMIVDRWKGEPGKMEFFELRQGDLESTPPIIHLCGIKFRRDFGEKMPKERRIKSVAMAVSSKENFEVKKTEKALSAFFGVPTLSLEEAVNGKYDIVMQILTYSSNCITITFRLVPELAEVGPRIGISYLVWELTR
jgi:rRNA maturation protein Rpf1